MHVGTGELTWHVLNDQVAGDAVHQQQHKRQLREVAVAPHKVVEEGEQPALALRGLHILVDARRALYIGLGHGDQAAQCFSSSIRRKNDPEPSVDYFSQS